MGKELPQKEAKAEAKAEEEEASEAEPLSVPEQLAANVALIDRAVRQKETRALFGKLLRQTAAVRKALSAAQLQEFVQATLPADSPAAQALTAALAKVGSAMDTEGGAAPSGQPAAPPPPATALPEVEIYAFLLGQMLLIDLKQYAEGQQLGAAAVERLGSFNRRTLDVLGARAWALLSLAHERGGSLAGIRSALLAAHRTACLRHDAVGAETLLNLLLRNYLAYNLYDQAEKLRAKAQRGESPASSQQAARYLYYLGRIRAIQLEYSDAKDALQQAQRKAPRVALGFRVTVQKWLVLVRLLLGEVPDRSELTAPEARSALVPYFDVTQAVRSGDLHTFSAAAARWESAFAADGTLSLVTRLRHNVLRAGLRRVAQAYSRISLADVAARLGLPSVEDTEGVVAKAIRDGNIDAVIDHAAGVLVAAKPTDVYSTDEPAAAFHARIAFCMDVHNEAVRAMRFDGGAHAQFEDATTLRVRQEQELAAALEDDEMDF